MFNNNCDSKTNGEEKFFNSIQNSINTIFDIGCRSSSIFTSFNGEVHYFDPVPLFVEQLKTQPTNNSISVYNTFGLGNENKEVYYYPRYESFYDRINSCGISDDSNKVILSIKKASDYILENNVKNIDFLKIDTEGYELEVLKGFGDHIKNVKFIQFEYGGTFLDNNLKLIDIVNYLRDKGFEKFSYIHENGTVLIDDFKDHYQYCNIICLNKNKNVSF